MRHALVVAVAVALAACEGPLLANEGVPRSPVVATGNARPGSSEWQAQREKVLRAREEQAASRARESRERAERFHEARRERLAVAAARENEQHRRVEAELQRQVEADAARRERTRREDEARRQEEVRRREAEPLDTFRLTRMWFGCRTRDGVAIMLGTSEIVAFTVPDYAARFGCDLLMSGSSWRIVQSELPYFLMRPASESAGTATLLMTNNVLRNRVGETPEAVYLRQINARVP